MAKYEDIYKLSQEANNENMSPLQAQLANQYANADRTYAETVGMAEQARQNAVYDAQNAYKTNLSNYGRAAENALGNGMRGSGYSSYADAAAFNAQRGEVAVANSKYADAVRQAQYAADQQKYAANDAYEKGLQGSYDNLANLAMQGTLSKDEILKMAGNAGITNAGQLDTLGTLAGKSYDAITRIPMLEEAYSAGQSGNLDYYRMATDPEAKKRMIDGIVDTIQNGGDANYNLAQMQSIVSEDDYARILEAVTKAQLPQVVGQFDGMKTVDAITFMQTALANDNVSPTVKENLLDQYIAKYGNNRQALSAIVDQMRSLRASGVWLPDGYEQKIYQMTLDIDKNKAIKKTAAKATGKALVEAVKALAKSLGSKKDSGATDKKVEDAIKRARKGSRRR